jgi:tetratricopeptide (TPR) repeat protein
MRFIDSSSPTLRKAEGTVPVALLADGDYVARVVLMSNGRAVGRVTRPWTLRRNSPTPPAPAAPIVDALIPIAVFDLRPLLTRQAVAVMLDYLQPATHPPLPEALTPALGLSRIGRFAEARTIAEQSGATHHARPFFIGLGALAAGDLNTAAQAFADALKAAPDLLPATFYLGACYAAAGRDADAVLAWRTGLLTDARAPWTYTTMADALLRSQNVRLALDVLTSAVQQWPEDAGVRARLGAALLLAGLPVDAVRTMTPLLTAGATDSSHWWIGLRAMHLVYASGRTVDTVERDLATFDQWAAGYASAGGREADVVASWRRAIRRD